MTQLASLSRLTDGADPLLDNLVEEFANRVQAGEPLGVEAFAAAHPKHAERLRQLLTAVQALAELGRPSPLPLFPRGERGIRFPSPLGGEG